MKLRKNALFVAVLLAANICSAAVLPTGSRFDPRNQVVSYNPQNTTVINSAVGYTTTLVLMMMKLLSAPELVSRKVGR